MLYSSLVIASLIVCLAVVQLALAIYFYWIVRSRVARPESSTQAEGLVSVLMSVRGCDPTLPGSLSALLDQDYPEYDVHLVVDHRDDFAWTVVHEIKEEFDLEHRLTIHEMRKPLDTCGLKCNALVQALECVAPETEFLVLIDADVTPHRNWLHELTSPLSNPTTGVVTGNQWFEPHENASIGSVIRSLWNAGAIVPTAIFNNPWAGTFAMRMEDVRRAKLADVWRQSAVDDGPIRHAIEPLGLKIKLQPSLIMVNEEDCTLDYVNTYVTRMLTWSKLYEKTFVNTVVHALFSNGLLAAAFLILVAALFASQPVAAMVALCGIICMSVISAFAYLVVRAGVNYARQMRGEALPPISIWKFISLSVLVPATMFVYGSSCFRALVSQQISWREITYEVKSKSRVRMLQYSPMLAESEKPQSKVSI